MSNETMQVPRSELLAAIDFASVRVPLTAYEERQLRAWASTARRFGCSYETGCPLVASGVMEWKGLDARARWWHLNRWALFFDQRLGVHDRAETYEVIG